MYRSFREAVEAVLTDVLEAHDIETDDLGIEDPPSDVDAILASNIAFRVAGERGAPPPVVAEELADECDLSSSSYIDSVHTVGPYLNFTASDSYYTETLTAATAAEYGSLDPSGDRVVVEHTSANPTGPVHVGRARNPIIGDSIARLLSMAGDDVERHYYVNDAGRQIAVFTWAYETFDADSLEPPERDKPDYDLVRYYRKGNAFLDEADEAAVDDAEAEIQSIMQGLERGDTATLERVHTVVDTVLGGMQQTLARLPAEFDEFVKETRFMRNGHTDDIIARLQALPNAEEIDDAWVLHLDDAGIDKELVFVRSDGTSLYPTRDLAHHEWKLEEFDRAVTVLGEDHKLQAKQIAAGLDALGCDVSRLDAIHYSWVNLPGGEGMSTRQGTGIDLDDLLDEAIRRARTEVESRMDDRIRDDDLDTEAIERIARQVGIGAVRYDIVAKQASKAITFEWDRALNFEAQSAPYLQYVHARCCGIMNEADIDVPAGPDATILTDPAERDLIERIGMFPAVIEEAAADLEPHRVATYCRDLAETFNVFYRECQVIGADVDPDRQAARLALVAGAKHTMANALNVLGIEAPTSM